MKRKFIVLLAAMCLILFAAPCYGLAAENSAQTAPFRDVETHWAKEDIAYAYSHGIVSGVSATEFSPNSFVTRGQFIAMLYNLAGRPPVESGTASFADVPVGKYYFNAVQWASENNIIFGRTFRQFCPDGNVTREELAEMLHRYFFYDRRVNHPDTPSVSLIYPEYPAQYTDCGAVSEFADRGMRWAVGLAGIISGKTAATLNPKDFATRAEAAAILHRFASAIEI